jgi:hypothetical protein
MFLTAKVDFSTSKAMKVILVCTQTFTKLALYRTLSFVAQVLLVSIVDGDAAKTRTGI